MFRLKARVRGLDPPEADKCFHCKWFRNGILTIAITPLQSNQCAEQRLSASRFTMMPQSRIVFTTCWNDIMQRSIRDLRA
ncbi:hypothetical protein D3OALGA1CA_1595 [Olavius algarvensis associated proteobacterium Delta 3]|nr:hypothetical protein D3OALGB2SA_394 [Olavius algarvensis associated proteobacterium Delta 3]CAB5103548.1 hypothetical protein D3OALGA1CA_1595 [Olavius algarvensis associated proteobacterium Delta 3]